MSAFTCKVPCRKDWQSAAIRAVLRSIPGAQSALRSCPAGSTAAMGLRWCGARAAAYRMEDLNDEICQEAICSNDRSYGRHEDTTAEPHRAQARTGQVGLQAIACHCNAAIACGCHDRRDDESH